MSRPHTFVFVSVVLVLVTSGCGGITAVRREMLPPGLAVGSLKPTDPSTVSLIKQGVRPSKNCVRLARLSAIGS